MPTAPPVADVAETSVKSTAVSVGIVVATLLPPTALTGRVAVTVQNLDGANPIYLGGSDVTSASGLRVAAGAKSDRLRLGENAKLYAIATGGAVDVRVLEES